MRVLTWSLILAAAATLAAGAAADPPVEAFAPLPPGDNGAVLPPGSAVAAGELSAAAECHPAKRRAALVALRWRPAAATDETAAPEGLTADQRVELSKFRDGFGTGRLVATRRLPAAVGAVAVDSPEPGIHYYWRVLTWGAGGWTPSAVERFEVPVCPYDQPDLSRFEASSGSERR